MSFLAGVSNVAPSEQQGQGAVPGPVGVSLSPLPPRGPSAPPRPYPPPGTGITSLQIRQEKEAELRSNDAHWQRRINQLEETHQKINELMEKEYSAAVCKLIDSYYLILDVYTNCQLLNKPT